MSLMTYLEHLGQDRKMLHISIELLAEFTPLARIQAHLPLRTARSAADLP